MCVFIPSFTLKRKWEKQKTIRNKEQYSASFVLRKILEQVLSTIFKSAREFGIVVELGSTGCNTQVLHYGRESNLSLSPSYFNGIFFSNSNTLTKDLKRLVLEGDERDEDRKEPLRLRFARHDPAFSGKRDGYDGLCDCA